MTITPVIAFIIGLVIGTLFGFFITAVLSANHYDERK